MSRSVDAADPVVDDQKQVGYVDIAIPLVTGAEAVAGSTRLKAATAADFFRFVPKNKTSGNSLEIRSSIC